MRKILVITDVPDPHVQLVEVHLKSSCFMIFDTSLFPAGTDIVYELDSDQLSFNILSEGRDLNLVTSVWFRKPKYLNPKMLKEMKVPTDYHDFILANHEAAVTALYDLLADKFWVSHYRNLKVSSNKIYQLKIAKATGFTLPSTLVTSSPNAVINFREKHGDIATKCVHMPVVKINSRNHMFPTTRIRKGDPLDLSGLGLAPSIFQEIVEKEFDLRVTVIGRKVFACAINRRNGTEDLDYRTGITNDQLDYQIHSLPEDVSTMCLQMLDFLGLQFGAFDFIFNKSGEYIFIELNPNGQWGWIEEATNLPMAKAMADLLERC